MSKVTRDQLTQMLAREGLQPTEAEIDAMLPRVQEYEDKAEVMRSAGLEAEELAAVFNPYRAGN